MYGDILTFSTPPVSLSFSSLSALSLFNSSLLDSNTESKEGVLSKEGVFGRG